MASAGLLQPQVNVGLNAVNLKDKILCRKYRPKSLRSVTSIFEVLRIFEVWPESPPDGYLHVFITLPKQYNNPTNWGEQFFSLFVLGPYSNALSLSNPAVLVTVPSAIQYIHPPSRAWQPFIPN